MPQKPEERDAADPLNDVNEAVNASLQKCLRQRVLKPSSLSVHLCPDRVVTDNPN